MFITQVQLDVPALAAVLAIRWIARTATVTARAAIFTPAESRRIAAFDAPAARLSVTAFAAVAAAATLAVEKHVASLADPAGPVRWPAERDHRRCGAPMSQPKHRVDRIATGLGRRRIATPATVASVSIGGLGKACSVQPVGALTPPQVELHQ